MYMCVYIYIHCCMPSSYCVSGRVLEHANFQSVVKPQLPAFGCSVDPCSPARFHALGAWERFYMRGFLHGKLSKWTQCSMPQALRIPSFQFRSWFFLRIAKVCGFLVMLADTALCTAVTLSEGQRKESQLSFLIASWAWLYVLSNSCMDSRCSKWRHLAERPCKAQKVRKQKHPGTQEMYLSHQVYMK